MIRLTGNIEIEDSELIITAIRSQGAGGQHVNKASTAIHLRFPVRSSSLPDFYKARLLKLKDSRITKDGDIIIKSQQFRSREKNREEAIRRLGEMVNKAGMVRKKRKPTRPSRSSRVKRLEKKVRRGRTKEMRKRVDF